MRNWTMKAAIILISVLALMGEAYAVELGITTGSEKGTYYQFGLNLKELVKQYNFQLNVLPSNGSIDNINLVYRKPQAQLGIVQSDVLAFVARVQTNQVLRDVSQKIKMVFPLYNEEIHLIGKKGISGFDDLTGKKVAIGAEGSGTYVTAKLLFEVSKIKPGEILTIGPEEGLAELKAGKIDAMFYVAGYPVKLFTEKVSEQDGLALLPILNPAVVQFYPNVEIPAGVYAWQKEPVSTVAVKAVLIAYNFRTTNCYNIGQFAAIIADNMDWLIANGHPKWKAVDLDYPLKGWEQYDCVRAQLEKSPKSKGGKSPADLNPVLDAIKEILR